MLTLRRIFLLVACAFAFPGTGAFAQAPGDGLDANSAANKIRIRMDVAVAPYAFKDARPTLSSDAEGAKDLARDLYVEFARTPGPRC